MTRTQRALVSIVVIAAAAGIGLITRTPPRAGSAGTPPRVTTTTPDTSSPASPRAPATTRGFDYYLVALSWSPTWCESNPHDREQCGARGYGFVLHGLWPQYERGGGPQDCPTRERPDAATVARSLAFMPSRRLIEHEWRAHGACSGLDVDDYFALSDRAYAAVRIPPAFQPRATPGRMDVDAVRDAFIATNPGLEADMFAVVCRARDLAEVRVCVDTDLAPRRCGRDVRTRCPRNVELRIPTVR